MNWIIASLMLFVSSVLLYLFVRKSQLAKIPDTLNNLTMFALPTAIFFFVAIIQKKSFVISWENLVIIFFASFFFSYLGNAYSLKSIKLAPNPGYSLIISKSYVVFTTIIAVFFLNAHISVRNAVAIACIVIFSALVMISKSKKQVTNKQWILYAFGAFFGWGFLALVSKYLLNQGVDIIIYSFYIGVFVSIMIIVEMIWQKTKLAKIKTNEAVTLAAIGLAAFFLNLFMQLGFLLAPNIGYINAVNASSISMVTLLSAYFFKDELTLRKIIGVAGVTAGLILLLV